MHSFYRILRTQAKHTSPVRAALLLSFPFLTVAFALAAGIASAAPPTATPPSTTPPPAAAPRLDAYNVVLDHFNTATKARGAAADASSRQAADALIAANIQELKTVAASPELKADKDKQATLHNLIGYLYLTEQAPEKAIPELQQTVALNPKNLDAHNNLGNALRQTGRFDEAAAQYGYVLDYRTPGSASPNPTRVKFNRATALGQAGRTNESLALFSDLTAGGTGDAATYKNYGFFLQKAGRGPDAAAALHRSAVLNPKDGSAWLGAGELYERAGQHDEAIESLNQALSPQVSPPLDVASQYDAHFTLGEAYAGKGGSNDAITQFDTAAALQPGNATPMYNKGVMQEQAGLKTEATASYRDAVARDGSNVQAQTALGLLLADLGQNAEAATVLTQASSRMLQDAQAAPVYSRLGDVQAGQKNYYAANNARRQALALNPADTDTRLAWADSLMAQKQYVSALTQYTAAARERPADAAIQNQRGVAYQKLKQYPRALAAFQKALALNPRSAQVQNNIGVIYENLKQRPQAIVAYKKALLLDPNLMVARANLKRFAQR